MAAVVAVKAVASTTPVLTAADGSFVSYATPDPPPGLYTKAEPDWRQVNVAEGGFPSITDEHVQRYASEGYVLVRGGFDNVVTANALEAIDRICAEADPRFEKACEGTVFDPERASLGYDDPGMQFEAAGAGLPKGQRAKFVRKLKNFHGHCDALDKIVYDGALWEAVSKLLGLPGGELEIFQSIALLKLAGVGREKPWHQDQAYFNVPVKETPSGAPTHVVGMWMAVEPATIDNGCMHVLRGHRRPYHHFQVRDWQICDTDVARADDVALPMNPGDVLLFSGLAPHGTAPNKTDKSRKAVQLHLVPKDYPRCTTDERLEVFGNEGRVCQC